MLIRLRQLSWADLFSRFIRLISHQLLQNPKKGREVGLFLIKYLR